jgi:hypothetical protein
MAKPSWRTRSLRKSVRMLKQEGEI